VQRYYAASVRHETSAEVAAIEAVSGAYFPVLRARAHLGRLLGPDDDQPGSDPAAVISYAWWQAVFGGREDVLGQTLRLNFEPFTIVGVTAPDFAGSNADARPMVWMPLAHFRTRYTSWDPRAEDRDDPLITVFGRVRDGATLDAARDEITRLASNLDAAYPRTSLARRVSVRPATWIDPAARADEAAILRVMSWAALGFLLLVCANVANILLSIASTEARSNAIRAALGASPGRLLRETLARNVILAGAAGILGIALAIPLSRRLGDYFARPSVWGLHVTRDFPVDGSVALFGFALALLTGVIAAIPSIRSTLSQAPSRAMIPDADLRPRVRRTRMGRSLTLRDAMIAVQSGLAVALLILSGLVLRTFAVARDVNPGFETDNLVGALVSTSSLGLARTDSRVFFDDLLSELRREPWVRSAAEGDRLPLSGHPQLAARSAAAPDGVPVLYETVRHDFMETLALQIVDGRDFEILDETRDDRALLNRVAADRLFPDGGAVGSTVRLPGGDAPRELEVIGVVDDARLRSLLQDPEPAIFVQFRDAVWPSTNALLIRTNGPANASTQTELRRWLSEYAPHMTVINSISYGEVIRGALYTHRMNAELFSGMAALGLALACAGIFSVVSLSVLRRRREIGIRKAIGATEGRIQLETVRRALLPVITGGGIGFVASLFAARLVESLLFGVSPLDPATLMAGALVLLVASAAAALIPAWTASRISPRQALVS